MALECESLFQGVASQFGRGVGGEKIADGFIRAVNRALDELSLAADLATRHSHIASTGASISTLDEEYGTILYAGIIYWIYRLGHLPADPRTAAVVLKDSKDEWEAAKGEYVTAEDNDNQATSTNDVWGLGDVS